MLFVFYLAWVFSQAPLPAPEPPELCEARALQLKLAKAYPGAPASQSAPRRLARAA